MNHQQMRSSHSKLFRNSGMQVLAAVLKCYFCIRYMKIHKYFVCSQVYAFLILFTILLQ